MRIPTDQRETARTVRIQTLAKECLTGGIRLTALSVRFLVHTRTGERYHPAEVWRALINCPAFGHESCKGSTFYFLNDSAGQAPSQFPAPQAGTEVAGVLADDEITSARVTVSRPADSAAVLRRVIRPARVIR